MKITKITSFVLWNTTFQNVISLSIILGFPIGKLKILISQNRFLKTLCFAIEMRWFLMNFTRNHLISIAKHNVFRTRFHLSESLVFQWENLIFWWTTKVITKYYYLQPNLWTFVISYKISIDSTANSNVFWSLFVHQNIKFSHWKT